MNERRAIDGNLGVGPGVPGRPANPGLERPAATLAMLVVVVLFGLAGCSAIGSPFGAGDEPAVIGSEALDRPVRADDATEAEGGAIDTDQSARSELMFDGMEFTTEACQFEIPRDLEVRCGRVIVPSNWQTGEGSISLAVAVFAATTPSPAADPVIYLEGGPGSHTLETLIYSADDLLVPLLERGDAIFFDQRGVGLSTPRLGCDEVDEVTRRLEDDPDLSEEEATAAGHDALARCRQRLIDIGIVLGDYNSINNANDVEAIRVALGYERWNLYGISYGTKLGLEVMRRHPGGLRAVVLDSVYPPQVDSVRDNPSTFVDSYEAVVAACGREPACADGGDLAERVAAVVASLDETPIRLEVRDWIGGETDEVFVTGETLAGLVTGALYSRYRFTDLPELIDQLEAGNTEALQTFLNQERSTERFFTSGMFYAVACHEEISFAVESEVAEALPPDPFGRTDRFDLASNTGLSAFGTCQAFDNGQAPILSNTAVVSDVPTLLMAGVYDPVTPVSWAEAAAETLSAATLVVAPHQAHGVSPGECGMGVVRQFLDQAGGPVNSGCFDREELRFIGAGGSPPPLEPVSYDVELLGVRISTVRPTDWSVGSLNGDQYRQQSFLDPVQLIQLGGIDLVSEILVAAFSEEFGVTLGPPRLLGSAGTPSSVGSTAVADLDRQWRWRSGRTGSVAVEWFETEIDGVPTFVVLSAPTEELNELLDQVLVPALQVIRAERL